MSLSFHIALNLLLTDGANGANGADGAGADGANGFLWRRRSGLLLLLQFRVADAGVVDRLQLLDEYRLGIGNVTEGNGTFLEVTLCHLVVDQDGDAAGMGLFLLIIIVVHNISSLTRGGSARFSRFTLNV